MEVIGNYEELNDNVLMLNLTKTTAHQDEESLTLEKKETTNLNDDSTAFQHVVRKVFDFLKSTLYFVNCAYRLTRKKNETLVLLLAPSMENISEQVADGHLFFL